MKLVLLFLFTTKKIGIERLVNDKAGTEFRLSGSRDRSILWVPPIAFFPSHQNECSFVVSVTDRSSEEKNLCIK